MDWAHIRLTGWRGWQQDRWIYFYHNGGPVVVVDEARGPAGAKAALIWHLPSTEAVGDGRFRLGAGQTVIIVEDEKGQPGILGGTGSTVELMHLGQGKLWMATMFVMEKQG